jgi:hypothetical protein
VSYEKIGSVRKACFKQEGRTNVSNAADMVFNVIRSLDYLSRDYLNSSFQKVSEEY